MEKLVPAIGHSVAGPIGVMHLPRLWLKAVLSATGRLADGWSSGYAGVDRTLIDDLRLDKEALYAFLQTLPSYRACEEWLRANAPALNAETIAAHNQRIVEYRMSERFGVPRRAELGLTDTDVWGAVILNDLDDWNCLRELALTSGSHEPIAPLVSSQSCGRLGIKHLPRLWAKAILNVARRLPLDRHSLDAGGCDERALRSLGLDVAAARSLLRTVRPTLMEFETWVQRHAERLDADTIAEHNTDAWETPDDVHDWEAVHAQVVIAPA